MKNGYTDKELNRLGWDEKLIQKGQVKCKNCGKESMLHSVEGGCPLPKKGMVQNYSQTQRFEATP